MDNVLNQIEHFLLRIIQIIGTVSFRLLIVSLLVAVVFILLTYVVYLISVEYKLLFNVNLFPKAREFINNLKAQFQPEIDEVSKKMEEWDNDPYNKFSQR